MEGTGLWEVVGSDRLSGTTAGWGWVQSKSMQGDAPRGGVTAERQGDTVFAVARGGA